MFCQKCGYQLDKSENVCPNCGALKPGKKFCPHCRAAIDKECIVCPKCGKQVEQLKGNQYQQPQVIINNSNSSSNVNTNMNQGGTQRQKDKWVAFFLCLFLGMFGAHKFYEGKTGMGLLYLFTVGLLGFGWFFDLFIILSKPNPYYV